MTQIPDAAVQAFMAEFHQRTGVSYEANIRASLEKTLPHLPLGFEVKKLEWELLCGFGSKKAKTPFGEYKTDKHHMQLWLPESEEEYPHFSDDPFKEAQADFERRVRECIIATVTNEGTKPVDVSRAGFKTYMRIVDFFDKDDTAGSFLNEDGEGGFLSGIYRMAREIDRLREANPVDVAAVRE